MTKEYWDTCLFIAYLKDSEDENSAVDEIDALIRAAQSPSEERIIVVSTLVLAELRQRDSYDERRWRTIRDIFYTNRSYIRVVSLSPRLAHQASEIGSQYPNLTPPDAVHVATALYEKVDALLTLDGRHEHGKRRRKDLLEYDGKIGNPPLNIKPPYIPGNSQVRMRGT